MPKSFYKKQRTLNALTKDLRFTKNQVDLMDIPNSNGSLQQFHSCPRRHSPHPYFIVRNNNNGTQNNRVIPSSFSSASSLYTSSQSSSSPTMLSASYNSSTSYNSSSTTNDFPTSPVSPQSIHQDCLDSLASQKPDRVSNDTQVLDDLARTASYEVYPDTDLQFGLDNDSGVMWDQSAADLFGAPNGASFHQMDIQYSFSEPSRLLLPSSTIPKLVVEDFDDNSTLSQTEWSVHSPVDLPLRNGSPQPMKKRSGRNKPLSEDSRVHAAMMRRRVACQRCKLARCKCGVHDPCKACITKFGVQILQEPCRKPLIPRCVQLILPDGLQWCPSRRSVADFFGAEASKLDFDLLIPLNFKYGPSIDMSVRIVFSSQEMYWEHTHVVYPWPPSILSPSASIPVSQNHTVFPAVLSNISNLPTILNSHLETLIKPENIAHFPAFKSGCFLVFEILYGVYQHFCLYEPRSAALMNSALKLLTLIHVGTDVSVDMTSSTVQQILSNYAPTYLPESEVVPCFIRAQIGGVMPNLALRYLSDILQGLFRLTLLRSCEHFLSVHAITAILTMALESLQYHGAKIGLHENYSKDGHAKNFNTSKSSDHLARTSVEEGIGVVLRLYKVCFGECHRRLLLAELPAEAPIEQQQQAQLSASPGRGRRRRSSGSTSRRPDPHSQGALIYTRALNRVVSGAWDYLEKRAEIDLSTSVHPSDLCVFFDRWLARLYLLRMDDDWDTSSPH